MSSLEVFNVLFPAKQESYKTICSRHFRRNVNAVKQNVSCDVSLLIPITVYTIYFHPCTAHHSYSLRKRQHGYQLPHIEYNLHKNSFINRCLFNLRWLLFFYTIYHTQAYTLPLPLNPTNYSTIGIFTPIHHSVVCELCVLMCCVYYSYNITMTLICFQFTVLLTLCMLIYVSFIFVHGLFVLILS